MRSNIVVAAVGSALLAAAPGCSSPVVPAPAAAVAVDDHDRAILAASRVSPEAFVRALLKIYEDGNVPFEQAADNRTFFSAATTALIARIVDANPEGAFNADPFCDCQDWMSLKVSAVETVRTDQTHASVKVAMSGDSALTQLYVLVRESGGWRLHDIVHPAYGSMVAGLERR